MGSKYKERDEGMKKDTNTRGTVSSSRRVESTIEMGIYQNWSIGFCRVDWCYSIKKKKERRRWKGEKKCKGDRKRRGGTWWEDWSELYKSKKCCDLETSCWKSRWPYFLQPRSWKKGNYQELKYILKKGEGRRGRNLKSGWARCWREWSWALI